MCIDWFVLFELALVVALVSIAATLLLTPEHKR